MSEEAVDAIVVGSGAGGAAAAYQLVQRGLRVRLIEKGFELPRDGSTLDVERVVRRGEFLAREPWVDGSGRRVVPEEHFNVGGKTKWYGAALLRMAASDFEAEPEFSGLGWPIRYAELAPYYEQAERLLGVREIAVETELERLLKRMVRTEGPWRSAPLPLALSPEIARHRDEAMHFDGFASVLGLKEEAEQSLLRPLQHNVLLQRMDGVEVMGLLGASGNLRRVAGVRLADGREFRAPHIVLAAGALHSPRLLARYLRASALEATLPAAASVGRHLKLHLLTAMVAFGARRQTDLIRKTAIITHVDYPHTSAQPLGFDAELLATLIPRIVPRVIARALGERAYGFFLQTEDGSDARNMIVERAQGEEPVRVMDYEAARLPRAVRELRQFSWALQRALLRAGMLAFTQRIGLAGTAHACGTLVCGTDPAHSVVDGFGRVHGLQGLYVVDGSVLPRISRVNPALTIYAWALRIGALIAAEHASGSSLESEA